MFITSSKINSDSDSDSDGKQEAICKYKYEYEYEFLSHKVMFSSFFPRLYKQVLRIAPKSPILTFKFK